jgi:putative ABC transport system permease protein
VYPNLTLPLIALAALALGLTLAAALRRPYLRRLALRQVARRPAEALTIVAACVLGTALIVASLSVGDTLNSSVRQVAYQVLGPIDETATSTSPSQGAQAAARLAPLRADPRVDGLLTVTGLQSAVTSGSGQAETVQPRGLVWEADFPAAARFGGTGGGSGLSGATPGPGRAVVNDLLASSLHVRAGDPVDVYLYDQPHRFVVERVVPAQGLAGMGLGDARNYGLFVAPGTLEGAYRAAAGSGAGATAALAAPVTRTLVSNRGGVEGGNVLSDRVAAEMSTLLGPLNAHGTAVAQPKKDVLDSASRAGDQLGALFLFIGSFAIIAGALLLVNVFVMLGEERKSQLGMARAVGMKRSHLVGGFVIEGCCYSLAAGLIGTPLGIGVGRIIEFAAQRIFAGWNSSMTLHFSVSSVSLVNGFCAGLLIALATVAATSIRISRFNIIAAIRDLPADGARRSRRRTLLLSGLACAVLTAAAVPAVVGSTGPNTYLLPSLAALCAVPLAARLAPRRWVYSGAALLILAWGLTANLLRPRIFDNPTTTTYIILGTLLAFAAVVLVVENQEFVLKPLTRLVGGPTDNGLATRLAIAYPIGRRFRTGATLVMYCLVVLTLVLMTELSAMVGMTVDHAVSQASAGYTIRADVNPGTPIAQPQTALRSGDLAGEVAHVTPVSSAPAKASDPGTPSHATTVVARVYGVSPELSARDFALSSRLASLGPDDRSVWRTVESDPRYVVLESSFAVSGGPPGSRFSPGAPLTLTDPQTGRTEHKIVAGLLSDPLMFYGANTGTYAHPVLMSQRAAAAQFGPDLRPTVLLVQAAPGVSAQTLAADLQRRFFTSGLVATQVEQLVRDNFSASQSFFQLMNGFLALGLVVGIAGLGVMMTRAVRERRRTIGVLRALGVQARTIRRSFLMESTFIALEGILLGAGLGLLTTYLLYTKSSAFNGINLGFPIAWGEILTLVGITFAASLLTTVLPARRAAGIRPAVAVRVAD